MSNIPLNLGTEKVSKLLFQYSIPAIVAMTVSSLYNIIDRIFIGQGVGPMAISGLALTLPLMNLAVAFGALVGVGGGTMVSIRLGQRKYKSASMILCNTVILNLILSVSYSIIMLIFMDPVLYLFGASPKTLPYAKSFLQIILLGNVFTHVYMGLNNIMRSSGSPRKAMMITLTTVGVNVVLAPVFIFVFKWGIRGAALATVMAQFVGAFSVIMHFRTGKHAVRFVKGYFKLQSRIVRDIFSIGMSNFIMSACASLVIVVLNKKLGYYGGDYAIGALGIINSVLMLVSMIIVGFNQGMQPIAGFNFGARNPHRVVTVYRYTVGSATLVAVLFFAAGEIFPSQIARCFTSNDLLIRNAVLGMHYVLMLLPVDGFQMVTANLFLAIGMAKISMLLSLLRQVFFLIPSILILSALFGLSGVWRSVPLADALSAIVTFSVYRYYIVKIKTGQIASIV